MSLLRIDGARRAFGDQVALDDVTLELNDREMLGLLGPNGAGKTTLVRALTGRLALDRGTIELFGRRLDGSPADADSRAGLCAVPQELALYPLLTARENLEVFGSFHGLARARLGERVRWALDWTGLADRAGEPIKNFSGGMKRRLNIACSVLHEPRILLLDEPTVGVDPQSRERIYDMLEVLRAAGASLLLTTHQLDEAEARCDRIAILDHGKIVAQGTFPELVRQTVGASRSVVLRLDRAPTAALEGLVAVGDGTELHGEVLDMDAELPVLLRRAASEGCAVEDLEVRRPTLQAVFIHLTGRELRE